MRWLVRELLKGTRKARNRMQRLQGGVLDQAGIVAALRRLGIVSRGVLLVHSSLSRLGFVAGGVDAVVMALQEAVGVNGTLGAPTFWTVDPNGMEEGTLFDAVRGKSQMGTISDCIRQLPGAIRSLHPTHSATFVGPWAQELTAEHHNDETPVGPHSPYRKLAAMKGKILLLGVTLEYLTQLSYHRGRDSAISLHNLQPWEETLSSSQSRWGGNNSVRART